LWGADDVQLASALPVAFDASPSHYKDSRHPALGVRWNVPHFKQQSGEWFSERMLASALRSGKLEQVAAADYHAHRISLGVPEGGKDYAFGDAFPHDANLDVLNGVSFSKGCFVGQEVVARMQHRATARKRIVIVEGDEPLQSGSEITAGASTIGTVGSVVGNRALALVRLDRAEEAQGKGETLVAVGKPVRLRLPDYLEATATAGTT
jgi:folate-binding protein YgfZ